VLFNSYIFILCFLPITWILFFSIAKHSNVWAAFFLFLASLFFYGWWNPLYVILLLLSSAFNYGISRAILGSSGSPLQKGWLFIGVAGDLAVLCYYKYFAFLLGIFGLTPPVHATALPLGISFFTFTQIAFIVDTYRRQASLTTAVHYGLFVTYFPHLIAGPLLHHKQIIPQFTSEKMYSPSLENVAVGITIFVLGLAKKVIIADGLAPYVGKVFGAANAGVPVDMGEAWLGTLGYTLQIYFDFSGYSDMAIGISRMFNVILPANFYSPYQSLNIIDFWRRWHITLSNFLRDYLYIPLGGNRKGPFRRYLNVFITMLLGGLWHGAGWTFIIWGGLHGVMLMVNHWWRDFLTRFGLVSVSKTWPVRLASWGLTFFCVVICWVFFRSPTLDSSITIIRAMFGAHGLSVPKYMAGFFSGQSGTGWVHFRGFSSNFLLDDIFGIYLGVGLFIALCMPCIIHIMRTVTPALGLPKQTAGEGFFPGMTWKPTLGTAIVLALLTIVLLLLLERPSEFLYFQF